MHKEVHIRCDGSSKIGLGHIVRCISLAHMLKDNFSIHFYVLEIPDTIKNEIIENGWGITLIEDEYDFLDTIIGNEIVVLDGYQFDSNYQKEVKNKGCKLVCIDDFHNQHFYSDLVINHAPGLSKEDYDGELYTEYLLGPNYALLRPEFIERDMESEVRVCNKIKRIFICFGGSDSKNLTSKILSWLPKNNYDVTVIIGNSYSNHKELNSAIEERSDLKVVVKSSLNAGEMVRELLNSDLAIIPASGILFEVISMGVPAISGTYVDNQISIYDGFKQLGAFIDAKSFKKNDFEEAFTKACSGELELIKFKQTKAMDGKSKNRIKNSFKKLVKICV